VAVVVAGVAVVWCYGGGGSGHLSYLVLSCLPFSFRTRSKQWGREKCLRRGVRRVSSLVIVVVFVAGVVIVKHVVVVVGVAAVVVEPVDSGQCGGWYWCVVTSHDSVSTKINNILDNGNDSTSPGPPPQTQQQQQQQPPVRATAAGPKSVDGDGLAGES
jgi:hypothetical protein